MSELGSIKNLVDDHEVILRALNVFNTFLDELEKGKKVPLQELEELISFFKGFVDGCHHVKEEIALFPRLNERGIPTHGGPIGVMIFEHEQGREYIKAMESALKKIGSEDEKAVSSLLENGRSYIELISAHISKENEILFPMGAQVLTDGDHEELREEFEKIERDKGHEKYVKIVERLEAQLKN